MPDQPFTVDDLRLILREGAGAAQESGLDRNILDTRFEALGYDSLALLETGCRIEGKYGIALDDSALTGGSTPRELIETVNALLDADSV